MNNNTMAEEDTLKIIGALLVIAIIYCLVEIVRYWQRNRYTYKKSHLQSLHEQEYAKRAAAIGDILKHEEALFKQPPPKEDCPICFMTLPSLYTGRKYKTCCGKFICSGCIHAVNKMDGDAKCPFCRSPAPNKVEIVERYEKRTKINDANAIYHLGRSYYHGEYGMPQDRVKALELWHQAGELGSVESYHNIGYAYDHGYGVRREKG